jgi:hypothetical protein
MDETNNLSPWANFKAAAAVRRAEVVRMHSEGKRVMEIAGELGICRQRVYQILGPMKKDNPAGSVPQ